MRYSLLTVNAPFSAAQCRLRDDNMLTSRTRCTLCCQGATAMTSTGHCRALDLHKARWEMTPTPIPSVVRLRLYAQSAAVSDPQSSGAAGVVSL